MPLVGFAGVVWVVVWLVEGMGGLGMAGTLEVMKVVEGLGEILYGTFGWPLKLLKLRSVLSKRWLCLVNNDFTLFTAVPVLSNMYTDKDSNLISEYYTTVFQHKLKLVPA